MQNELLGPHSWKIQINISPSKICKASFNYYQFHVMANMADDIALAGMMTALDLKFKRALHYHDEGYKSNNDYGLLSCITRLVYVYSVFSAEASFNPADYTTTKCQLSPFNLRHPRGLPFWEGDCQCLTFDVTTLLVSAADSEDEEEDLPTAELDDPMWDEEPVPDSREYLCIHEIPWLAIPPPQPMPVIPSLQLD